MGIQNKTNRLIHFDLMRIIACFFVILIHVGIFDQLKDVPNQSIDTVFGNLYGIISRWAVPCFFMLSGLMFLDKNKEIPLKKLYGKYILRLAVAYVVWSCIYAIYNSFYDAGPTLYEKFKYFLNYCISGEIHTWYVLVTIGLYIALPIIKLIIHKANQKAINYWIIAMFIFASVIPFIEASFIGSNLNTEIVSSPNLSIIFFAVAGPIPFIAPFAKYLSRLAIVLGIIFSKVSILNCLPYS